MSPTSLSLLKRLVNLPDATAQGEAWEQFAKLYTPLLLAWARDQRLQDADAADFVQEVLLRLARVLPKYQRVEGHRFRGWLFTLVRHQYRDFCALRQNRPLPGPDGLSGIEDIVPPDAVAEMDEKEYRLRLTRQCMDVIRSEFSGTTWDAFQRLAVEGQPVAEVAAELGITSDAVQAARRRVVERLREELGDFLE